jgi:histidinol-phosphate aminotransferase
MDAVAAAITDRTKLVVLATPNNPTGTALSTRKIVTLLEGMSPSTIVVIDEAYREFLDPSLGDPVRELVPKFRNVVVTRTFSKAHGMAGIRAGYAIADPEVIAAIDKTLFPFAVSALAQAAAIAAIDAEAEIARRVADILSERKRVIGALTDAGWKLPDAQANFVYLPIGAATDEIYLGLEQRGVVTRPFSNEGIRVTVSTPEENDRFLATLAEVMAARDGDDVS